MRLTGIGIDICRISRIQAIMEKKHWNRFVNRVLSEGEMSGKDSSQFVAGRWAAKEALVKATANREIIFNMIEVTGNGKPTLNLLGRNKEMLKNFDFFLSITHEVDLAAAVVVAVSKPSP